MDAVQGQSHLKIFFGYKLRKTPFHHTLHVRKIFFEILDAFFFACFMVPYLYIINCEFLLFFNIVEHSEVEVWQNSWQANVVKTRQRESDKGPITDLSGRPLKISTELVMVSYKTTICLLFLRNASINLRTKSSKKRFIINAFQVFMNTGLLEELKYMVNILLILIIYE